MTSSLTNKIPVELWDEIFSLIFLLTYPSVFDFTSPFHGVYHLRRINDFDLHQWRQLSRCRTRLRLVCKDWNIHVLNNLRWVHRISPRTLALPVNIPRSPIAVLDCEDCPLDTMRMIIIWHGGHIRSLHIRLECFKGLDDIAKMHLSNLVALSIHIDWEPQSLLFCDIADYFPGLKTLSLSAGRRRGILLNPATSPLRSLGCRIYSMPSLEILDLPSNSLGNLDLPSNSQEILKVPSQLRLPVLRHLYGRGMDILRSRAFLNQFGHQLRSLGLYGSTTRDCRVTYEEFFKQLPKLTLLAVDFRTFKLLEAPPPTLGHLDTLVHLGPVYPDLFSNSLVVKFLERSWNGNSRKFRMSDVWLPSRKSKVRRDWIKKNTLHYSKDEHNVMTTWAIIFHKAGVRLEDMEGLTYVEAMGLMNGELAS